MAKGWWTPERVDELQRRLDAGETFAVIGEAMGCGKNSAISRFRRRAMKRSVDAPLTQRQNHGHSIRKKPPRPAYPTPTGCRWVHGHVMPAREYRYCDAEIERPGESWCEEHRARVFVGKGERVNPPKSA